MGRPVVDLTGKVFGNLTVIRLCKQDGIDSSGRKYKQWECVCTCGNHCIVRGDNLKKGHTTSCGCKNKIVSIIGQQFEDFVVLKEYSDSKGKMRYVCQCKCGKQKDISRDNLLHNRGTKCTHINITRPNRIKDLTGQKFGRLTVLYKDENDYFTKGGNKIYQWICQCDCGTILSVERNKLKSGHTQSCGCLHAEKLGMDIDEYRLKYSSLKGNTGILKDLTGKKFGKLTVLRRDEKSSSKCLKWVCKCECGSIVSVSRNNLNSGHTRSCGCIDSVGESKISNILNEFHINFKTECTFNKCKDKHKLPFDFGIYNLNNELTGLIEFDGKQHFEVCRFNGMTHEKALESFKTGQIHDQIKNQFCKTNNIPLLRIKYTDIDNVRTIVFNFCKDLNLLEKSQLYA